LGTLDDHEIVEHEDGTITVSPSIECLHGHYAGDVARLEAAYAGWWARVGAEIAALSARLLQRQGTPCAAPELGAPVPVVLVLALGGGDAGAEELRAWCNTGIGTPEADAVVADVLARALEATMFVAPP